MNILFVNNFFNLFANADSGASQRSMRMIHALAQMGHVDVVSFVDNTVSNMPNVDVLYSGEVDSTRQVDAGRFHKFLQLFRWRTPYEIYPIQQPKEQIIDEIVHNCKYDCIVVRYIHCACNCGLLKYADRLYIDIDDDPKQVVMMSLNRVKTLRNKIYNRFYANTVDKVSREVLKRIKGAFFSTPNMSYPNAQFLPNISIFDKPLPPTIFDSRLPTILMVGFFTHYPNEEGLIHFIKNVFPLVRKSIPNAELRVVGRMPMEGLRYLCEHTNGVEVLGFVDDILQEYQKSHCVIVPLYKGTGTSVKLVEAMSLGRAVVATPCGARGLHNAFVADEDYFLAESDNDFAEKIICLLINENTNKSMANNALKKSQQYYSSTHFNQIIASSIKRSSNG